MRLKTREQLKKHIKGKGIEIGALQNPLDLTGLDVSEIKYVDRLSLKDLREHYPELDNMNIKDPDIIDDCETLKSIEDNSLDFIIANHLIEHLSNPVGSLVNWHSKLRKDGIIFLAAPDMDKTFDKKRDLTTLEHLIIDSKLDPETRNVLDKYHFYEWAILVQNKTGEEALKGGDDLHSKSISIHYHTFKFKSLKKVIQYLNSQKKVKFKIVDFSQTHKSGNEFIFILRKI